MKIKDFLIFKNEKKSNEKAPDYEITVKVNEKFLKIGGVWLREGKNGKKFFSCKLSEGYKDIAGFSLVRDNEITTNSTPSTDNIGF